MRTLRLLKITSIALRYGLDEMAWSRLKSPWLKRGLQMLPFKQRTAAPRGVRLRCALVDLGPIFVKFGQLLSTRRDLLPDELADELVRLQDRVPPFDSDLAVRQIEHAFGQPLEDIFSSFDRTPVASASIAQVHFGVLKSGAHAGREVAVKVLRPHMHRAIERDLELMHLAAVWIERLWKDGRRLRLRDVVTEFDKHLHDELDLMREAANAGQLRRNFQDSPLLRVPEMIWDYCAPDVIVMERMSGIPVSQVARLKEAGIDIKQLSANAVEVFFMQALRDGFFHADMHPGNIYVGDRGGDLGRWIALDFGIVGTLTERDKSYLAQNFLAFFRKDYRRVAQLHVQSGWVPADTRVDELESAIRAVCEPIFDKPLLKDISFAQVLQRLFAASRRFNVEVQPQLVLLQKTLFNIEGLGRQLNPELDLWATAMPFLERHLQSQIGLQGLEQRVRVEAAQWAEWLPQVPRLVHQALVHGPQRDAQLMAELRCVRQQLARANRLRWVGVASLAMMVLMWAWLFFGWPLPQLAQ